ncbi:ADP-ribose diphosphatase [Methylosoma difficile]
MTEKTFQIIDKEPVYQGFFRMEKFRLRHTLFAGGWSKTISREIFYRGFCVGVLLYDPDADAVVLIEQFRIGAMLQPDRAWLVEIVAGAIEAGETAEEVAYRESQEEAGCEIEELLYINEFFTTPGCSTEKITLFCGKVDSRKISGIHGLAEEDEDIQVKVVGFPDAYQMIYNGTIESAIPIVAIQWLALNREMLRQKWCAG